MGGENSKSQRTINAEIRQDRHWFVSDAVEAFLVDRKSQGVSPGTMYFYRAKFRLWLFYCTSQVITRLDEITPDTVRRFLLWLEETNHNPGGIHAAYRALKAFLNWWEAEYEEECWRNPMRKVKAPKVPKEILAPVELVTIKAILATCKKDFYGLRDRAVILALCDTGARASELLAMNIADMDWLTGEIIIRRGKGGKARKVALGQRSRRAIRAYLKARRNCEDPALWVSHNGRRLLYEWLRGMFRRRSIMAGIPATTCHAFRRFFARSQLNAGVNIYSLKDLMGHEDLQMLMRYLKEFETGENVRQSRERGSPADRENL